MMGTSQLKLSHYLLLLFLIFSSCKTELAQYIPEKHPDLSQGEYDKYSGLLNAAYANNHKFRVATQLANLKGDKEITFQNLNAGIRENSNYCEEVYKGQWLYDRHGFAFNLVKLDTNLHRQSVNLCSDLYEHYTYDKYVAIQIQEEENAEANKIKEDSTNFNIPLVRRLEQIQFDDQDIRKRINAKSITPEMEDQLYQEMEVVDSINLIKIDKIFKEFGYPSQSLVGKDCNFIPALVIHHSKDLDTRYKYLSFLEESVEKSLLGEGTLNMIKKRIEDIELSQKTD